jgi:hypothetical protein
MMPVLVTGLMLSGTVGCSPQSASSEGEKPAVATASNSTDSTSFECVQQGDGWATIAKRGNVVSVAPLLTWNSTYFGPEYTPEQRCKMVSRKLTDAVNANGGKLGNLDLTTGQVDKGYTVVCLVTEGQKNCTLANMLFTLNKENAKDPSAALAQITNFAQGKATDGTVTESGVPQSIVLETLVNRLLPKDSGF